MPQRVLDGSCPTPLEPHCSRLASASDLAERLYKQQGDEVPGDRVGSRGAASKCSVNRDPAAIMVNLQSHPVHPGSIARESNSAVRYSPAGSEPLGTEGIRRLHEGSHPVRPTTRRLPKSTRARIPAAAASQLRFGHDRRRKSIGQRYRYEFPAASLNRYQSLIDGPDWGAAFY